MRRAPKSAKRSRVSQQINLHDLSVPEAMYKFVSEYNKLVQNGYRGRIEIIHGYGSSWYEVGSSPEHVGKIRRELREYLQEHSSYLDHFTEGERTNVNNPGVTNVYPLQALPALPEPKSSTKCHAENNCYEENTSKRPAKSDSELMQEAILRYCKTPKLQRKVETKLQGDFRPRAVRTAIHNLVKQSRLQEVRGNGEVQYKST